MAFVKRLAESGDKIILSNRPGPDDVENVFLPVYKVKSILSLDLDAGNVVKNEIQKKNLQRKVVHLFMPISPSNPFTDAKKVERFIKNLQDPQYYPMLIHCQAGKDRTGFASAIWLREKRNYTPQKAIETMNRYGYGTGGISKPSKDTLDRIIGVNTNLNTKVKNNEDGSIDVQFSNDIVDLQRELTPNSQNGPYIGATPPAAPTQQSFAPFSDPDGTTTPNSGNIREASSKVRIKLLNRLLALLGDENAVLTIHDGDVDPGGITASPGSGNIPLVDDSLDNNNILDVGMRDNYTGINQFTTPSGPMKTFDGTPGTGNSVGFPDSGQNYPF